MFTTNGMQNIQIASDTQRSKAALMVTLSETLQGENENLRKQIDSLSKQLSANEQIVSALQAGLKSPYNDVNDTGNPQKTVQRELLETTGYGAQRKKIRAAIARCERDTFTKKSLFALDQTISRKAIGSELWKMAASGEIVTVRKGVGRRASIYKKGGTAVL
jgi:hypothetical protein